MEMILSTLPSSSQIPFTVILLYLILPLASSSSSAAAGILYSPHCGAIVHDPPLIPNPNPPIPRQRFLALRHAHVDYKANDTSKGIYAIPRSLSFFSNKIYRTQNDAVFKIEAVLNLVGAGLGYTRRGLRLVHFRPPRIPVTSGDRWNSVSDCSIVNCNFLGGGNGNFTPRMMYFNEIECLADGSVRFLLGFGDFGHNGYQLPFEPNVTLVSEGKWDANKRRLNLVGCRIFSDWYEGFVGECLIRLSLRFPARWTLRERSSIVGELWSSRSDNESGYFGRVLLTSIKNKYVRAPVLRYDYTEIENAKRFCENIKIRKSTGKYPNALSSDMRFDMAVGNRKEDLWGYSSPLYVDIRYPPLHPTSGVSVKGTIKSTREKSDRLYFEPFEIISRSIYANQAKESIWRIDLEITMK
ncbi:hypothetical protein ACJIZ3_013199 [Penstemon smallii]|uniref:DUF2921 domain-containing protein n=1 Tax=Penstemon smallii TaxID=265156 RepID=A0ABD3USS5_9LAMI